MRFCLIASCFSFASPGRHVRPGDLIFWAAGAICTAQEARRGRYRLLAGIGIGWQLVRPLSTQS